MSRSVNCRKFGKILPGLEQPPFPGPLGQHIYDNVSQQAWEAWQHLQTMLINEKHLSLQDMDTRHYLLTQMKKFFNNEETDKPTGYSEISE